MSSKKTLSVKGFLLRILIFLPAAFVLWYYMMPAIIYLVTLLSKSVLLLVASNAVIDVEQHGNVIHVVTKFAKSATNTDSLAFVVDVMKYAYGLALFPAMVLATPKLWKDKFQDLYLGLVIIFIVIIWGVTFDTMLTLVFKLGEGIGEAMGTTAFTRELIALGYQLGYLILPAITPIILWFTMNQEQVIKLAPKFAPKKKAKK